MEERLIPTRDLFLCQPVVLVAFLVAQRLGYVADQMLFGLALMFAATALSAYLGSRLLRRANGALNVYSIVFGLGTLVFWLKWWVLD